MEKNIIAAISDNRAIGKGNSMPWHIPEDLKYFKKTTAGSTVVMGMKTFLSIGKPLPGRTNIVVTRGNGAGLPEGAEAAHSMEEALRLAETYGKPCFIIGGGEIYRQAMPYADTLYITHVHTVVQDADTYFPEIPDKEWTLVSTSPAATDPGSGYTYEFSVYHRKKI